jgi:tetratricopeptide (TPR) repeat protein
MLPSDTMPRLLRDELEGIDFYIAQGYVEIARGTLDRLRVENGDHPEILARYERLGEGFDLPATGVAGMEANEKEVASFPQLEIAVKDDEPEIPSYNQVEPVSSQPNEIEITDKEFFVQKESGPFYPDLLVQLNTSELLNHTPFDVQRQVEDTEPQQQRVGTSDLIESLVSSIDSSLDSIEGPRELSTDEPAPSSVDTPSEYHSAEPSAEDEGEVACAETAADAEGASHFNEPGSARDELQEIFEDLKEQSDALKPLIDFETHYSLGLAYKDMELLDEAISEFQMAFRTAGTEDLEGDCINCCNMLGVCFKSKAIPKIAIMWFERGLKIPNRLEDEYQALRYEIGICYEEMGEIDKAIEAFTQVYGIDVNYRKVAEKIKQLQAAIA